MKELHPPPKLDHITTDLKKGKKVWIFSKHVEFLTYFSWDEGLEDESRQIDIPELVI